MSQASTEDAKRAAAGHVLLPDLADWTLRIDRERIAWATFDRAARSANALGRRPLEELGRIIAAVEAGARDGTIIGLALLGGKPKSFIVGADIDEFETFATEDEVIAAVRPVNALLDRIEQMPVPAVVAFHGACVGGGLELALACHYRIATRHESTRVGFPEVKLGLFPGFNGTARAIRQVGPVAAMEHMLTGRLIRASTAKALGYVDRLVASPVELRWAARKAILARARSKPAGFVKSLMAKSPLRGQIANRMRAETRKKVREEHYPAPFRLIDLFEQHGGDIARLKREESVAFAPLMVGDTSRNLRRVFKLSEQLKAQAPRDLAFRPLRVHVIGAGTMGADIAGAAVASGMLATVQDLSAEQIERGIAAQEKTLKRKFRSRIELEAAKARLIADQAGSHLRRADVVIEAIVENVDIKRRLFADIEARLKPGAVIATNTSSIMIEDIAGAMADPSRLVGIHFFNPVAQMPLVEVIHGRSTQKHEIDKACAFVTALGKFPLIVASSPGFLVNYVLAPYMFDAMQRVGRGTQKERIDAAAKAFGMPMGPIELADTVGLDVCLNVSKVLGAREADTARLAEMVTSGKLGKKSGEGFYRWSDGKPQTEALADETDLEALGRELVGPLIDACETCLTEGRVASADLVDAGVIFGTGFAPFRGGPLHFREMTSGAAAADPIQAAAAE